MRRSVVTGLGFITSIGNDYATVLDSLKNCKTGIEVFKDFADDPKIPVRLMGTVKGFHFGSYEYEDWSLPEPYKLRRDQLRSMTPGSIYGYCSMQQAIADAGLSDELVSHPRTGLMCATAGSQWLNYENMTTMLNRGPKYMQTMSTVNSISSSLYINLGATFKIKGGSLVFASACSSSGHALGAAVDWIGMGRQDIAFVVGAEDITKYNVLPFASARALSTQSDPSRFPCAFDKRRDGFVGTGGGVTLVVEELEHALKRGAKIYAEVAGWSMSSDGYHVMAPQPDGEGLARCIESALEYSETRKEDVDYINAHATSTPLGDVAEAHAIKKAFENSQKMPWVSSTKSITGHGLSMASALESAICCLAIQEGFYPVSAHIEELDPECAIIPILKDPLEDAPEVVLSNSSGFGGTNVVLVFKKLKSA